MAGRIGWKVIGLLGVAVVAGGCEDDTGKVCTDIGCVSGVNLSLAPKEASWEDGDYELRLELDGRTRSCSFTIGGTGDSGVFCGTDLRVSLSLGSDQQVKQVLVNLTGEPKTLGVRLARGDTVVLSDSRAPDYERVQPNEGCEPICQQARLELTES